jgi:hypothetical protein
VRRKKIDYKACEGLSVLLVNWENVVGNWELLGSARKSWEVLGIVGKY